MLILVAQSSAGKDFIAERLVSRGGFEKVISSTTRCPRSGEIDGKDYRFMSRDEFESRIDRGEFFEFNQFSGNYYGKLFTDMEASIGKGACPLSIMEPNGAVELQKKLLEKGHPAYTLFLQARPDLLQDRMIDRFEADLSSFQSHRKDLIENHSRRISLSILVEPNWAHQENWDILSPSIESEEEAEAFLGEVERFIRSNGDYQVSRSVPLTNQVKACDHDLKSCKSMVQKYLNWYAIEVDSGYYPRSRIANKISDLRDFFTISNNKVEYSA